MDISLRPVEAPDVPALYALHRDAMGDYIVATWGPWDDALQRRFFEDRVARGRLQVIEVDGGVAGMWEVQERTQSLHLENIEIASWLHRRGIGRHLLRALQDDARGRGCPVTLQVLHVNPARALYERLGFVVTGEDETHIQMRWDP